MLYEVITSYVFFYAGRKKVTSIDASIFSLIEPLLNPIWVFILIGEKPSYYAIAGMVLILSAQVLNAILESKQSQALKLQVKT